MVLKCEKGECDQLSLYEVEQAIDESESLSSEDQRNLLLAYDQIIQFLEEGEKKYQWSGNLRYDG